MKPPAPTRVRPLHLRVLLVAAVLAGLVGMHGLVTGSLPAAAAPEVSAAGPHAEAGTHGCHDDGAPHAEHADETCAAASVPTPPLSPPPEPSPLLTARDEDPLLQPVPAGQEEARGPPTLAELQLLRV